ncbi:MAG: heavy metal translocating P-type ATPase [Alphaproteobacteria bacterium]|nr:heavy metal translocating P-type ATPase [Alphaproteobacteria bacterium]
MAIQEFDIDGMTCAGCARTVEKALSGVPGVAQATVNLALERAHVEGDASSQDLIAAVGRAGYAAWRREDIDPEEREAAVRAETRKTWLWLGLSAVLTVPFLAQMIFMVLGLHWMMPYWLEPLLAAPVVFGAGFRFHKGALHAIRSLSGTMDLLVSIGTGAAYFYSLWLVLTLGAQAEGHLYFEAAVVIITLVLFGKQLEARAKAGASEAIRGLMALRPDTARRETASGGEETVAIDAVALGDVLIVKSGERIPVDGHVVGGGSDVDESLVTGESVPVPKGVGDPVIGGAVNGDGLLRIEATAIGKDTTLSKITRLVERAQSGKAPVQKLVDRVSAVFVPIVLVIAIGTFAGWMIAGQGFEQAIIAAVSVLVIACPCALGLASPTAIVAGTGAAARAGILIKDVDAMERAMGIDTVLFDKTGTLTRGKPELVAGSDDAEALRDAVILQRGSEHPLANAFRQAFDGNMDELPSPDSFRNHSGEGITGTVDGRALGLGNRALMKRMKVSLAAEDESRIHALEEKGSTVVLMAQDGRLRAIFGLADTPRDGARAMIARLKGRGLRLGMISGDSPAAARHVAEMLGLDDVEAQVKPDRKARTVRTYQENGSRVAMVGDGINDAPALVQADLGIAMGTGAEIALDAAPITLMRPDLDLVAGTLEICRRTVWKIRQNLFWAFIYNVIGLPLAAFGYLSPAIAGAAMAMSSVSVVTSSLLLRRWRP